MAQCDRETSGSSISMSAPPPLRPIIVRDFVISHSVPCASPNTISSRTRSPAERSALGAPTFEVMRNATGSGFSRELDDDVLIVFGAGSGRGVPIVAWHIQHLTICGASCGSSRRIVALHRGHCTCIRNHAPRSWISRTSTYVYSVGPEVCRVSYRTSTATCSNYWRPRRRWHRVA
jgi:hypothetical protein